MKKYNATAYDRKQAKELLAQGYKYLSRDEDGSLNAWQKKPMIMIQSIFEVDKHTLHIKEVLIKFWDAEGNNKPVQSFGFKFIKGEDKEPTLIADIIHRGRI